MNHRRLGQLAGLELIAAPSALAGTLIYWIVLAVVAAGLLSFPLFEAILGGLVAVGLHWFSEFWHQWGHAWAARRTGYPMSGVLFWGLLGKSIYPADEPQLPANLHIRRALGGVPASLLLALAALVLAVVLRSVSRFLFGLALYLLLENVFIFGIGALLPLGFTDGSTLLHYWRRR